MDKPSWIYRFVLWILTKLKVIQSFQVDKSDMCKRAIQSGVCANQCESCAWYEHSSSEDDME